MDNEDQTQALNNEAEEVNSQETAPVDETNAIEETETPVEETDSTEEVETTEKDVETSDESESKKGASQRIRQLNKAKKEAEAKAQSLAERLKEVTGSNPGANSQPYTPQVQPGEEISSERYQQDVLRSADSIVQLRMKQRDAIDKINKESAEAQKRYPELDPDKSEVFDRELSESVTAAVEAHVRSDPYNASVSDFVDRLMKPYKRSVTNGVGKAKENLAKQVSKAALRPNSVKSKEKPTEEKTIEELEAELGVIQS